MPPKNEDAPVTGSDLTGRDIKALLQEPFDPSDVEWRVSQVITKHDGSVAIKVLAYITNRAIMNRLDDVFGVENWRNDFVEWHGKSQLCGISCKINGEWITKWDGADSTDIESTKGGLSDAMKRSAVQWGIGRYLYSLEEGWATVSTTRIEGGRYQKLKQPANGVSAVYWREPELAPQFLPTTTAEIAERIAEACKKYGVAFRDIAPFASRGWRTPAHVPASKADEVVKYIEKISKPAQAVESETTGQ